MQIKPEPVDTTPHFWSDHSSSNDEGSDEASTKTIAVAHRNPPTSIFRALINDPVLANSPKNIAASDWVRLGDELVRIIVARSPSFKVSSWHFGNGVETFVKDIPENVKQTLKGSLGHNGSKIVGQVRPWIIRNLDVFPEVRGHVSLVKYLQPDISPVCDVLVGPEFSFSWDDRKNISSILVSNLLEYIAKRSHPPWDIRCPFVDHIKLLQIWERKIMAISQTRWSRLRATRIFEPYLRKLILKNRSHFRQLHKSEWAKDWEFVTGETW
ncbi:hypothetical protein EJ05DRAFT_477436 [Pseudovirgaria hyperparasitica]|uniref:Uncharacterized protein n=1 Tax=Pseudovirgaria hyperparasitica TaxID=470096 RepID=A0A6A6W5B2_9PEZI|nr:uncharacterized protein EJ05DRAFT_477436 [Pseudovirgaria hyperparasitica]KAF2757224.1 hypothetical protein EJ05DRAFT_477436 [Pseudovirgaria hyperparasitica]